MIKIDYLTYIAHIKEKLKNMSEEEKDNWIYLKARGVQEDLRENFINSLNLSTNEKNYDIDQYFQLFDDIKDEKIYLETTHEDYYDEVYHDWDYETVYIDKFDIMLRLKEMINFIYEMIYNGEYEKSYCLLKNVVAL